MYVLVLICIIQHFSQCWRSTSILWPGNTSREIMMLALATESYREMHLGERNTDYSIYKPLFYLCFKYFIYKWLSHTIPELSESHFFDCVQWSIYREVWLLNWFKSTQCNLNINNIWNLTCFSSLVHSLLVSDPLVQYSHNGRGQVYSCAVSNETCLPVKINGIY